jgi:hypothetical protein
MHRTHTHVLSSYLTYARAQWADKYNFSKRRFVYRKQYCACVAFRLEFVLADENYMHIHVLKSVIFRKHRYAKLPEVDKPLSRQERTTKRLGAEQTDRQEDEQGKGTEKRMSKRMRRVSMKDEQEDEQGVEPNDEQGEGDK